MTLIFFGFARNNPFLLLVCSLEKHEIELQNVPKDDRQPRSSLRRNEFSLLRSGESG